MDLRFHPHALERLVERGATEAEVRLTVETGERIPAKFGRTGFRRNFSVASIWRGRSYTSKQIEVYAVEESNSWLVNHGAGEILWRSRRMMIDEADLRPTPEHRLLAAA